MKRNRDKAGMDENAKRKEAGSILKAPRMANLELLRCVAMMMVVVLHYLGKGNLLTDLTGEKLGGMGILAWLMEAFCIVAVNAYMLISGYFLSTSGFRPSRLIKLYLQLWFYSVGVGSLGIVAGLLPVQRVTVHDLLTLVFPVFMEHYWFVSAYLFLYLLLPFIGGGVQRMSKKQMQLALGLLIGVFSVLKSILPMRLELDGLGYDCIWYLCVFLTAAYIRRFGCRLLESRKSSACLYLVCCMAILAVTLGLRQVYLHTGSLGRVIKLAYEYNHILPYLAALGLFGIFLNSRVRGRAAGFINRLAPHTLGVYLLHENIAVRYEWQSWFGAGKVTGMGELLLSTLLAVAVIFTLGILVDMLRQRLFNILHALLKKVKGYQRLTTWLAEADRIFVQQE